MGADASTYSAANRLLSTAQNGASASAVTSDADGNTLVGNGRTNAWDSQNRLVSCIINGNTTAYKYGADGLRRQSTKNGVSTDSAYDGSMLVREGHASGGSLTPATVTATYFIGARGPEYRRDDTQTEIDSQGRTVTKARWYVYDGLGSVVGEVDPLGNLTSSPKYDVYGAVRANGGTATSKQGFVGSLGHVSDDTGLIYMRARYYDPSNGRFVSQDPKQSGNNWFTYCDNDPDNKLDKTGKETFDANWWTAQGQNLENIGVSLIFTGLGTCYAGCAMFECGQFMLAFGEAGGPLCAAALAGPAGEMMVTGGLTILGGLAQVILGAEMVKEGYYIENNPDEFADMSQKFLSQS